MVTLAAIFPPSQPPEQVGPVASAAEAAGLAQLWVWEDCFSESGIAAATAMLATTSQVAVGIGLMPVPLRNVAAAGGTHVAVNADEKDADLERFVTLLAREVSPLTRPG